MALRWKPLIAAAGLAMLAAGGIAFYQLRPVTVAVAQPARDVAVKVFGLGTVEARVLTRLGFKVAGTLIDSRADHGDRVTAGQVLARIDDSEQKARVAKARAQLLSAEAALQVAQAAAAKATVLANQRMQTNQRRQTLLARQAISVEMAEDAQLNEGVAKADLLVAQSEIESAKAKLDDARAQLQLETAILAQHELRAPFDGIVVARNKELGSVLAGGEALYTVVAPETVWMLAYVDESRAGAISLGQPVEIKLRSLPQQIFEGRVARIGIESDRVNEERKIYVTCDTCPAAFHLGEQAEVLIKTAVLPQALMVPEAAVAQFDGAAGTVWLVENGRLTRRRIAFGKRTVDGRIEVTGGVPEGARVVTTVSAALREGRSVAP